MQKQDANRLRSNSFIFLSKYYCWLFETCILTQLLSYFSTGTETPLRSEAFFCIVPGTIKHDALCDFKENAKPLGVDNNSVFGNSVCAAYVHYRAELTCAHEVPCF